MLGTGNAMVTHCYNTCFLLRTDQGDFLTDAGGGNGILVQLEKAGADYQDLHHMFVTHGHTDHVLGVIWVIRKVAALMNQGKYEGKFHIYCHDAVKDMLEVMTRLTLKKKDLAQLGSRILLHEVKDGDKVSLMGIELTAFDILSTKAKQFGYTLEFADGLKLACLGDEPYNEHDGAYVKGADWLLSEAFCCYGDREIFKPYEKHHSTVKEACETGTSLGVKHLLLYHTEDKDMAGRKHKYTAEAKQYFAGDIYVPDDMETIIL
jgi:ribonuclease Z